MKIGFLSSYQVLNINNRLFTDQNSLIGDDLLLPFITMKEMAGTKNLILETVSDYNIEDFSAYVLVDIPNRESKLYKKIINSNKPIFLILLESKHVLPKGYDLCCHNHFERIFTWDESLIELNRKKYKKINYSYKLPTVIDKDILSRKKCASMICGNKDSNDKHELYSKRREIISYYSKNNVGRLELFGFGWDGRYFKNKYLSFISKKFQWLKKAFYSPPSVYVGVVERKKPILKKYQFSFCLENRGGDRGYITEKIFDVMLAGSIPIYLGAIDIGDHIPTNCFIDMREYSNIKELDDFVFSLSDSELLNFQINIARFLSSNKSDQFSVNTFAKTILSELELSRIENMQ